MIELEVYGTKYLFDDQKAKQQSEWYDKREQHMIWVISGGMFGKEDKSEQNDTRR